MIPNDIQLIESTTKCCANCAGHGEDCDNGGAWIYCDIKEELSIDNPDAFDAENCEIYGCNYFKTRIITENMKESWRKHGRTDEEIQKYVDYLKSIV